MARIRTIKPEFWEDEKIGKLSVFARLMFICSMNLADDEGILKWNESYLLSNAFMYDDVTRQDVRGYMDEIVRLGLVIAYEANGTSLAMIRNFRKHQVISKPQPTKYPKPTDENVVKSNDEESIDKEEVAENEGTVDNDSENGAGIVMEHSENIPVLVKEHSTLEKEREKEREDTSLSVESVREKSLFPAQEPVPKKAIPYFDIQSMWNRICTGYPTMTQMTDKRKDKIRVRWDEFVKIGPPMDVLRILLTKMQDSRFMRGDNRTGWKASFDWLVQNSDNWVKVYEGKYDNRNGNDRNETEKERRDREFAEHVAAKLGIVDNC